MRARTTLTLSLSLLLGCEASGIDDAGVDARRDAPRLPDAGFTAEALAPCTLDPALGFEGAAYASYAFLPASDVARRLFYPLVVLDEESSTLAPSIVEARRAAAEDAAACEGTPDCVRAALGFDEAEATEAGAAVVASLDGAGLASVAAHLRQAGVCALLDDPDDGVFVAGCVATTLRELSSGLGFLDEVTPAALDALVTSIAEDTASFHSALTTLIEEALVLADRAEPTRYEPLDEENRAALDALATTDFGAFPFAAIVVPGQGPNDPETALHPASRQRADSGYDRWAAGLAPVVLLSGGHVHPDRTVYSEAIEMRRYLIDERGMPASAILVDPYARHTTTNLRNATRILVRAGVPATRPLLVTTDVFQSAYIGSPGFADRCDDELGYTPFSGLMRLSDLDVCVLPVATSLHLAASDPLDP